MATYCVLRQLCSNKLKSCQWILSAVPINGLTRLMQVLDKRDIHTTNATNVNHQKEKAIVKHLYYKDHEKTLKHSYSPIVQLPDYTYLDGRPTEIALSYKEKQENNYKIVKQVVTLVEEVKFAQNELVRQEGAKEKYKQDRRKSQLKEKGHPL